MGQPLSSDAAFDLEAEVVAHVAGQRASWVPLAERLYRFYIGEGWKARSVESFNEWLGQPEISLSRGDAYTMVSAWRDLVIGHGLPAQELAGVDLSKLSVVLPAVKAGKDPRDALGDCRALSRSDLRAAYQRQEPTEGQTCPTCGRRMRRS